MPLTTTERAHIIEAAEAHQAGRKVRWIRRDFGPAFGVRCEIDGKHKFWIAQVLGHKLSFDKLLAEGERIWFDEIKKGKTA